MSRRGAGGHVRVPPEARMARPGAGQHVYDVMRAGETRVSRRRPGAVRPTASGREPERDGRIRTHRPRRS